MFSPSHRQFRGDLALAAGQSGFFLFSKEVNLAGVCQHQYFWIWGPSCLFLLFVACHGLCVEVRRQLGGVSSFLLPCLLGLAADTSTLWALPRQWPLSSLKWSQIKLMQHGFSLQFVKLVLKSRKLGVALLVAHESGGWCRTSHRSLRKNFHTPYLFTTGCGDWL